KFDQVIAADAPDTEAQQVTSADGGSEEALPTRLGLDEPMGQFVAVFSGCRWVLNNWLPPFDYHEPSWTSSDPTGADNPRAHGPAADKLRTERQNEPKHHHGACDDAQRS